MPMEIVQVEGNPTQTVPPTHEQRVRNTRAMKNPHYLTFFSQINPPWPLNAP